jgi:hypothetical protein
VGGKTVAGKFDSRAEQLIQAVSGTQRASVVSVILVPSESNTTKAVAIESRAKR